MIRIRDSQIEQLHLCVLREALLKNADMVLEALDDPNVSASDVELAATRAARVLVGIENHLPWQRAVVFGIAIVFPREIINEGAVPLGHLLADKHEGLLEDVDSMDSLSLFDVKAFLLRLGLHGTSPLQRVEAS